MHNDIIYVYTVFQNDRHKIRPSNESVDGRLLSRYIYISMMCVYTCKIYIKPTMLDGPLMSAEYLFTSHCPRALLNTPTAAATNATARVFIWRICIGTHRRKMYYFNKKIIYIRGKCAGHVFSFIPIVAPSRTYRRIPIFVFFPAGTCAWALYIYNKNSNNNRI